MVVWEGIIRSWSGRDNGDGEEEATNKIYVPNNNITMINSYNKILHLVRLD